MKFKKNFIFIFFYFCFTPVFADDKNDLGFRKFYNNKAQCGVCHTLKAAGSDGQIGPNLDELKPQIPQIIHVVVNGIGVMQPWKDILTTEEIEAVAYYIFNSTKQELMKLYKNKKI